MFPTPAPQNNRRFIKKHDDGTASIWRQCTITQKPYSVDVRVGDLEAWQMGELAQNAFPYLNDDQREFLISNTTPAEWSKMFS